ncbi:MAG: HD domain-containing protein [Acidimicrobiales bacterium]
MHRFTARYVDALAFAAELHQDQRRKHADVPYVSHLLAVSALVWEDGGDEVEATAALLHDAIEDQSDKVDVATIGRRFGADVAGIVMACTDALGLHDAPKPPWVHRKAEHLRHLADAPLPALRVTAADKLHNVRSLLDDRRTGTRDVWLRFNGRLHGTVWYYRQMAEILDDRLPPTVSPTRAAGRRRRPARGLRRRGPGLDARHLVGGTRGLATAGAARLGLIAA